MSKLSSKKKRRTGPITSTQRDFGDVNLDNIIYTSRDEQLFQRHLEVAIELSRKSSAIQDSQETKKSDPIKPLDQPSSPSGDGSSQETRKTNLATLNLPSSSSDELSQEKKKSDLSLNISEEMVLPATKDEKELKSNGLSQETKKSNLPGHSDLSSTSEEILLPSTKKRKSDEGFSQETKKSNLPGHSDLETTSEEIFLPPTKKRKSDGAQGDLIKKKNLPKKSIRILDSDDDDDSSFDDFQDDDSDEDFVMSKKPVPPAKKEKKNKLARSKKNDPIDEKKKKKDSKSQEDSPIRPKSKSRKLLKIESEDEDDDIIPDLDEDQPKAVVSKKDDSLKLTVKADSSNSWKIMPEKKSSPVKRETRIKKPVKKIESEEDDDDDFNMEKDGENVKPKQMANIINKPKQEQNSPKKSSKLSKTSKKTAAATTTTTTTTSVNKIVKTTPKVSTAAKPKDTTSVTPSPQPSPSSALGVRTRPIFQMPKWNPPAMIGKGSGNKSSPSSSFSALKISSNSPGIRVGLSRLVTQFLIWFVVF